MLKSKIENKGEAKPYISPYTDKTIHREDLEDREHVGCMKAALFPCTPDNWNAAVHYRLRTPSGKQTWPIESKPDPAVISGSETPRELRAELDAAEEARAAWMRRRGELFEAGRQATKRWQLAAHEHRAKPYDAALAEELRAAEQLRDIAAEEPLLVRRIATAHGAIRQWQYIERLRRMEAAAGR